MATYKNYTVQVEVKMHEGRSINDVLHVSATSADDAMAAVENDKDLRDLIADEHGGYGIVMCVTPQLAIEGYWAISDQQGKILWRKAGVE